jgi:endonuclease/exonuclease/phosphatase family metal-dependent hydrolase
MKKKTLIVVIFATLLSLNLVAQETFKTMFYNVLNFPLQSASKIDELETIINDYRPDLFMVCELNNQTGADAIINMLQTVNSNYQSAIFELNTSDDNIGNQNDLQNLIFYDSSKFILENQTIVTTIFRDFNHYKLKLNTVNQNANPVYLEVFVCHLKSSQGGSNQQFRLDMVNDLQAYLDDPTNGITSDSNVLLGGDLNIYTNSEPAFQELIDESNNTITLIDPANRIGSWHNNTNYLDVFTQSTRTQTGQGGATGGFDDRFDFIMTSESMQNNPELLFVPNSYKVFGNNNNSNCYNQEINSTDCSGSDFSLSIRNALYTMSDHLPVTLELQTSETLLSTQQFVTIKPIEIINSNIVSNMLQIKINRNSLDINKLKIYNVLGQNVLNITVKNKSNININVSQFANGIFYVTTSNNKIVPLKFVKAH